MERALQYMWEYRLWDNAAPQLCDGRPAQLLSPGRLNNNAGPDFTNARVRIDDTLWIGNVEVHLRASDWYRHGHQKDISYDNIILHVVSVDDARIKRKDGSEIPQLVLPLTEQYIKMYAQLVDSGTTHIRCGDKLAALPSITVSDCIDSVGTERIQFKAKRILQTLQRHNGDWQQTCFVTLGRALGFGVNSDPFEMLTNNLPLKIIHHHSDNINQIEAILFGCAGQLVLSDYPNDSYHRFLCNEFQFLSKKYGLKPMPAHLWKHAKMRPVGSPCRRLALLSKLLEGGFSMMQHILQANGNIEILRNIFNAKLQGYWANHYNFENPCTESTSALSDQSIDLLLINVAAPIYYAYGISVDEPAYQQTAFQLLNRLKPEKNGIISAWNILGIKACNAFESQALLQLRKEYCDNHRCMQCRWGNKLLALSKKFAR